jgi:hypothetical protein
MSESAKPVYYPGVGYPATYPATAGYPVASHVPLQQSQYVGTSPAPTTTAHHPIKRESRIEYHPVEKSVIEHEAVTRVEYVPRERKVVEHYAVEHQTEYHPQVFHDRYVEYIPQERVVERVEY